MLDLGMLYFNHDRSSTVTDVIDPLIIQENPQSLSDRLLDAGGVNFNYMFNLLEVERGYFVRLQSHDEDLSCFAFSSLIGLHAFRIRWETLTS
jgi:hypothetical protein